MSFNGLKLKIFALLWPRRKFLQYSWSQEKGAAAWYKIKKRNFNDLSHQRFFALITEVFDSGEARVCLELGAGDFSNLRYLLSFKANVCYVGIDFSDYTAKTYNNLNCLEREKIIFIQDDITNFQSWLKKFDFQTQPVIVITYGILMYLSGEELESLYKNLRLLKVKRIVSIEPTDYLDLDKITSRKKGQGFVHNYRRYLEKTGYQVIEYRYISNKGEILFAAIPK